MTAGREGAVLLLSAWLDGGALRVRLTASDDLGGPTHPVGVAGDVDGACELVRRWLQDVVDADETLRRDG
ncbi:hypothetical protein EV188_1011171 [Actinomycetospora succinea]|uniref:Uncharacterized protein n=1 Tax=Actinomycetospora succinea TaxID=663603 RepID=A0A4R6VPR0_9PSEU|nr:hypothetical protein [Actinomycetospora succinea]TDQ65919.1 hypothetical protein EV188_1011171 [Actinomycetospora succinea]